MHNSQLLPSLTIAIPTFNRAEVLESNLRRTADIVQELDCWSSVSLLISDNHSSKGVYEAIDSFIADLRQETPGLSARLIRQTENIGPTGNMLALAEAVETPYIMYLGDDDFISSDYLARVLEIIQDTRVTCIIPSYRNILLSGELLSAGRDIGNTERWFESGFRSVLENSWRGHQLSGLVFRSDVILPSYYDDGVDNFYPFVHFIISSALEGVCVQVPEYPVLVTRPGQANKAWSYGSDGMIGEIFDNYHNDRRLSRLQKGLLELQILDKQYWRYAMYLKLGPSAAATAVMKVLREGNAEWWVRLAMPIAVPLILAKQAVTLLLSGKLLETLKTPVSV